MPPTISHDFHWDNVVQVVSGKEKPGFLLARSGPVMASVFHAHYADGLVELIDPANGYPRPDPDNAVRSKGVAIPPTLQSPNGLVQSHASRYTGLMRRAVQCQFSRGLETKFDYKWNKTHGIIEYPQARTIGTTPGEEQGLLALRRQWVVEIAPTGVFAAPLAIGADCRRCAIDVGDYMPDATHPGDSTVFSLAWAYANKNESGAVLRLLDAAAIGAAYALGATWYTGMGWAFSWSGWAASNVFYRNVFDGESVGQPDYYETRLVDLAFSITFTGAELDSLTAAGGVATASMAGHGFVEGGLVSISGATPDDYNGAHVIRNVTVDSFQFSVPSGIASPATGDIQVADAAGVANITASLTIGAAGRVTFRDRDRGTLWVPGSEQFTRWDGVRPFQNFLNASGVVHVFYDREEKVVTNWSSSSTVIPGSSSGGVNSFNIEIGDPEYIGPIAQYGGGNNPAGPAHPCMVEVRSSEGGSAHSYSPYTNSAWGFSGAVSLMVDGYSRSKIDQQTTLGPLFHDAGFDWSNAGGYTQCPNSPTNCVGLFKWETWSRNCEWVQSSANVFGGGGASLILFPMEREAVAGLKTQLTETAATNIRRGGYLRAAQWRQVGHNISGGCAFTQYEQDRVGVLFEGGVTNLPPTNESTYSRTYAVRASGGINYSGDANGSPDFEPFVIYQSGVKETADSSVVMMRGGLENADPSLTPADQTENHVFIKDGVAQFGGGFATFPIGRSPVAFIGQV